MKKTDGASTIRWANGVPLHRQLKDELMRSIAQGVWRRGDALPTEPQLAERYEVSISTVRAAIGALVEAGLLVRRAGRGTHVAARGGKESIYQFFHVVPDDGVVERPVSEVIAFERGMATPQEALELRMAVPAAQQRVYRLSNILRLRGDAVQLSAVILPAQLFPGLSADKLNSADDTLYGAFQNLYGVTVLRTEDRIRAMPASREVASLLKLGKGESVLQMRRTAYGFGDQVIEFRTTHIRTSGYHFLLKQGGA